MRALLARIERLEQRGRGGEPNRAPAAAPARSEAGGAQASPQGAEPEPGRAPQPAAQPPVPELADGGAPALSDAGTGPKGAEAVPALESLLAMWPAVVDLVRGENGLLGALIAEARPVAAVGEDLTLAFAPTAAFLKKKAEDPANRMTVTEALRAVTGARWRLSYELSDAAVDGEGPVSQESEEEWVRRFMEEFDAEEIAGEWDAGEPGLRAASGNEKGA
jgi:DNA polymerase-3 subunit gamma/tau